MIMIMIVDIKYNLSRNLVSKILARHIAFYGDEPKNKRECRAMIKRYLFEHGLNEGIGDDLNDEELERSEDLLRRLFSE
jgi:hypothetical protein